MVDKRGIVPSSVVNRRDEAGRTPLYVACQYGNLDIVNALLEKEADMHIANRNGYTPLMVAREEKHYQITAILERRNAGINDQDPQAQFEEPRFLNLRPRVPAIGSDPDPYQEVLDLSWKDQLDDSLWAAKGKGGGGEGSRNLCRRHQGGDVLQGVRGSVEQIKLNDYSYALQEHEEEMDEFVGHRGMG